MSEATIIFDRLLRTLTKEGVTEAAIATGRFPAVRVPQGFRPIAEVALTSDEILAQLARAGGSRYVEDLGEKPVQWSMRVEGLGVVSITATRRGAEVLAKIVLKDAKPALARTPTDPRERPGVSPAARAPELLAPPVPPTVAAPTVQSTHPELVPPEPPRRTSVLTKAMAVTTAEIGVRVPSARPRDAIEIDLSAGPSHEPIFETNTGAHVGLPSGPHIAFTPPSGTLRSAVRIVEPPAPPEPTVEAVRVSREELLAPRVSSEQSLSELDGVLAAARQARASDLHLVSDRPLLLRVAGELLPQGTPIAASDVQRMIMSVLPEARREALEQHGAADFALQHPQFGRFRANVARHRTGLKLSMRLIPKEIPTLASLGLPPEIGHATRHHQGLIVLTGPTGHGKTTTLAALVDAINENTTHHLISVEDPVELVHPRKRAMISQREVGTHTRSFRSALKGSLREDPDVIVIGELRDTETVRTALSASETGHLVLGTMNTPSAAKTIDRLIDMFPPGDQQQVRLTLAGGLKLIVSQRLVPNIERTGMVAACEILPGLMALWNLIRDNKTYQIPSLQQRGKALGIVRLDDSLADLVRTGRATLESVLPWAEAPDDLAQKLRAAAATVTQGGPPRPGGAPDLRSPEARPGGLPRAGSLLGKKGP